jgi:hypothetical protein
MGKLLILFIYLLSSRAHSWSLDYENPIYFPTSEITINVATKNSCKNIKITHLELLDLTFEAAEKYWNSVESSNLKFIKGELKNRNAYNFEPFYSEANEVIVGCSKSPAFSKSEWDAYGGLQYSNDLIITQAYISLDATEKNLLVTYSKNALLRLLAHELGHTFGLAHSEDKTSLMYPIIDYRLDQLGLDDREAISWLYPR